MAAQRRLCHASSAFSVARSSSIDESRLATAAMSGREDGSSAQQSSRRIRRPAGHLGGSAGGGTAAARAALSVDCKTNAAEGRLKFVLFL